MAPGRWLMEMQVQVEGVPFRMPAVSLPTCLDADDVNWGVDSARLEGKGDCRFVDRRVEDDWIRYAMVCPDDADTSGDFRFRPGRDAVVGEGTVTTGEAVIRQRWTGRRTGDC